MPVSEKAPPRRLVWLSRTVKIIEREPIQYVTLAVSVFVNGEWGDDNPQIVEFPALALLNSIPEILAKS